MSLDPSEPQNARVKSLVFSPHLFKGAEFGTAARALWETWGGYGDRWQDLSLANSSSSKSSMPTSSSSSAKTYYMQDWWQFSVSPMTEDIARGLSDLKRAKEERDEANKGKGKGKSKQEGGSKGAAAPEQPPQAGFAPMQT
eukprot:3072600-Alexandrium_andersonii.AAC.1